MLLYSKSKALKAFTLGEVLVALFLLTVGVVVVLSLLAKSTQYSDVSQDIIIATDLAQEGTELVRNVRDNDFAIGNGGFSSLTGTKYCYIDYRNLGMLGAADCTAGFNAVRARLQYGGTGQYGHFSAAVEKYSRFVYVSYSTPGSGQQELLVRSFVYWDGAVPAGIPGTGSCVSGSKCVFVESKLTNWK